MLLAERDYSFSSLLLQSSLFALGGESEINLCSWFSRVPLRSVLLLAIVAQVALYTLLFASFVSFVTPPLLLWQWLIRQWFYMDVMGGRYPRHLSYVPFFTLLVVISSSS